MELSNRLADLTDEEIEALARAASWYASYFAKDVASEAGETHAYAVEERRSYLALVTGLRKLGIMFALPDALLDHAREVA